MNPFKSIITAIFIAGAVTQMPAQKMWINGSWVDLSATQADTVTVPDRSVPDTSVNDIAPAAQMRPVTPPPSRRRMSAEELEQQRWQQFYAEAACRDVSSSMLDAMAYGPAIFDGYDLKVMTGRDTIALAKYEMVRKTAPLTPVTDGRIDNMLAAINRRRRLVMHHIIDNPRMENWNSAFYNYATIDVPAIDPTKAKVSTNDITDSLLAGSDGTIAAPVINRRNWLHNFEGLVQFTQAYNSPNWYQGGNSNLNMLVNAVYSIKLNPKFHPNLLFENTLQYKLVLASAPEDELRNYSINEDLLQFNTKFGVRAAKRWFYSLTGQLKTQTLNNYISNTNDLKAAFMSPGELNFGLGMTYNYLSKRERLAFDVTIAPLSYNLKTCLDSHVDGTAFGIKAGRKSDHQFGANTEAKLTWKIAYNIVLTSRLYAFTDYGYVQGDWENTVSFSINRFLSTQVYAHLRYDSQTPRLDDSRWHKWQLKEIFSFGFAYKFANI